MNLNKLTGIYKILNKITNDFYIGSARKSFATRFRCHKHLLKCNKHNNIHLQRAWNKYEESNFEFIIIEQCLPELCLDKEQYYIDILNPHYNISKNVRQPTLGIKMKPETIEKLRQINLGRPAWNKGIPFSEESRKKMSLAKKGKSLPWMFGKRFKNKPIIRNDGKIYQGIWEAALDLKVKENTIVKACTDKKQLRQVKGYILNYI